ncbi:hypothetical protein [Pseudonocardia humida]|uniref:Uncharacterized protein n=1 Tax=Pseudonocardia humida TaxID=2800819 RepID=A0ABT0ZYN6_9PSEU|nr:hypothetical protein [Pseudonocardia humida]MCO1655803.1 hypothetical protein [Pseudonocardia humida]
MGTRSRRSTFRAWGWVLAGAAGLLAAQGTWDAAGIVALTWVIYVLFARTTQCRAETASGSPCNHSVAGLWGSCGFHRGAKWRSVPLFVRDGALGLPRLMWPRPVGSPRSGGRGGAPAPAPRPSPSDAANRRTERIIAVAGLAVAAAALVRDLIAG